MGPLYSHLSTLNICSVVSDLSPNAKSDNTFAAAADKFSRFASSAKREAKVPSSEISNALDPEFAGLS